MKKDLKKKKTLETKKPKVVHSDGLGEIKNPVNTIAGKVVIWLIIGLMGLLPLAVLIYTLIERLR